MKDLQKEVASIAVAVAEKAMLGAVDNKTAEKSVSDALKNTLN